jgi:hypothetical protein
MRAIVLCLRKCSPFALDGRDRQALSVLERRLQLDLEFARKRKHADPGVEARVVDRYARIPA